jgi:hypothetical protein
MESNKRKKSLELPPIKSNSSKGRDRNKYYIAPNLRYRNMHIGTERP